MSNNSKIKCNDASIFLEKKLHHDKPVSLQSGATWNYTEQATVWHSTSTGNSLFRILYNINKEKQGNDITDIIKDMLITFIMFGPPSWHLEASVEVS